MYRTLWLWLLVIFVGIQFRGGLVRESGHRPVVGRRIDRSGAGGHREVGDETSGPGVLAVRVTGGHHRSLIVLASIICVGSNPSRSTCLQDRPVPLEIACPAVEDEGQQAVGPPAPTEGVTPLDLVASESVPPDEVVQCAGTGGGAHRRHE